MEDAVSVSFRAMQATERMRAKAGVWPELSLAAFPQGLRREPFLSKLRGEAVDIPDLASDAPDLLGALYVLHGSSFGSAQIVRSLRKRFPDVPEHYFFQTRKEAWRALMAALEALSPSELDRAVGGATALFRFYHALATEAQRIRCAA